MIASLVFLKYGNGLNIYVFAILFCFTLLLRFVAKYQENKLINEGNEARAKFREIGERIPIMYDELEIKTNSWMQEVEVGSGTQSRNEYVKVNLNVIILEKIHRGHHFKEEFQIDMEPEILRMKLALQNELSFYYKSNDFNDNFLDLEFLLK
jgi:hypothetical protein